MMKTKLENDIHNGLSPIGIVKLVMIILFFYLQNRQTLDKMCVIILSYTHIRY